MRKIKFDEATIAEIRNFAETHTFMESCNRFTLTPKVMGRVMREHSIHCRPVSPMQSQTHQTDDTHIRKNKRHVASDLVEDGNGFMMCEKPEWYTGRAKSKHVYYHNVVMCASIGLTEIPKGFVVRHLDGDKRNNSISNLVLMSISADPKLASIENNLAKVQRSETIRRDENPETPDNG